MNKREELQCIHEIRICVIESVPTVDQQLKLIIVEQQK